MHLLPDVDGKLVGPNETSMDYMYFHERREEDQDGIQHPPNLVMIEHKHGRIWAYRVLNKGASTDAAWLARRILQDLDNVGYTDAAIQFKTDREPAIVQFQAAIQNLRAVPMIPINSPVVESECNGRVENVIQREQEKTLVLRHQLETNIKGRIKDDAP